MDLQKHMQKLADAVNGACDELIKAKLIPEEAVPSINDMIIDNASATKAALRGSLVRFPKAGGGFEYRVVPFLDEVFSAGGTPKLQLIDKWGGAAKATKLADLEHEGPLEIALGILTIGGSQGTAAAGVKVAGLADRRDSSALELGDCLFMDNPPPSRPSGALSRALVERRQLC